VKKTSPTGLVPVLKWRDIYIGESLSIAEFLAESYPEKTVAKRQAAEGTG
jgi:glutathione S-transferase